MFSQIGVNFDSAVIYDVVALALYSVLGKEVS